MATRRARYGEVKHSAHKIQAAHARRDRTRWPFRNVKFRSDVMRTLQGTYDANVCIVGGRMVPKPAGRSKQRCGYGTGKYSPTEAIRSALRQLADRL